MSGYARDKPAVAPELVCRWLHGGPELDDLTSIPLAQATKSDASAPPSVWRSFTEEENTRLEEAWNKLDEEAREKAWRAKARVPHESSGKTSAASSRRASSAERPASKPVQEDIEVPEDREEAEEEAQQGYIADLERESQPHIVQVSQDHLFSADLLSLSLYPVFWKGARIGVQRATWFYPSTSLKKFYPVDPLLAHHLEEAYHEIQPFEPSYADELKSALDIGVEGEAKLKHSMIEVGVDVIFQSADSARVYARNLPARLSKSFLTSFIRDRAHSSGGTLVYRGYDTILKHLGPKSKASKAELKIKEKKDTIKGKLSVVNLRAEASSSSSKDKDTTSEDSKPKEPKPSSKLGNLFSFGYGTSSSNQQANGNSQDAAEVADDNTTSEAMEGGKDHEDGQAEPELAELVLVIHGIGQKLAENYDGFNIVHAINQLRKLCNQQARDPAIAQVINNKRLQFIPLQWRSSLQFDEMDDDGEGEDAQLDNRFTLDDIQVEGAIPFVRSLVTGVAMDLAFYLSHHRDTMTTTVIRDANRIFRLFKQRNPNFKGKVSLIAHSLGTALATDILSKQPTFVPELSLDDMRQPITTEHFNFNVSSLFFLGSPVGYMFFLNRAQLIARSGRARTKNAPKEIALEKAGRYGCMAIDSLYNVYNVVDPVACSLNACVDVDYARAVKAVPINSVTSSLLADYASKAGTYLYSWLPSFGSNGNAPAEKGVEHVSAASESDIKDKMPPAPERPKLARPKTKRQFTSELDLAGLKRFQRAEARMLALNPQGTIDFYLPAEGFSQYYDMLLSHASYWHDVRFATFLVTQLLASPDELTKAKEKREEEEEQEAQKEAELSARADAK